MSKKTAAILLKKYQTGTCSPEEKAIVENYIIFDGIIENQFSNAELDMHMNDLTARLNMIHARRKLWPYMVSAAAVLLIISTFLLFNKFKEHGLTVQELTAETDIHAGKNMATLTLANGKVITLSKAKTGVVINSSVLKYNDGSIVGHDAGPDHDTETSMDGTGQNSPEELLTASTLKGGTYRITLPDGTEIWMNAASTLKFPVRFSGSERRVILDGEAYFEVFKDHKHPFIVEAADQRVQVLGTHFNINAYQDEPDLKTTLLEGSVKTSGITLKPGEQAVEQQGRVKVSNVNTSIATAWKNGEFRFNNERLESIMRNISRWYNVDITYKIPALKNELFSGAISRYGNVSEVLQMLELTGTVHFRIEGRRITIMK